MTEFKHCWKKKKKNCWLPAVSVIFPTMFSKAVFFPGLFKVRKSEGGGKGKPLIKLPVVTKGPYGGLCRSRSDCTERVA